MIALIENFQEEDGSVRVPQVLHDLGAPRKLAGELSAARRR
jgi:seryl-tRNA synthetase